MISLLHYPTETDRQVTAWAAEWASRAPVRVAYQASAPVTLRLRDGDVVLSESMTPELGARVVEWLADHHLDAEPYWVPDCGRSYLLVRFSDLRPAAQFLADFADLARPAARHLPEEF